MAIPDNRKLSGKGWRAAFDAERAVLILDGDWSSADAARDSAAILALGPSPRALAFEASGLGHWDSSLLVFLSALRQTASDRSVRFDEAGLPEAARRLLALLPERVAEPPRQAARGGVIERVGGSAIVASRELAAVTELVGEAILRTGGAVRGRASMRSVDLVTSMQDAGIAALPIVAVVNLLVGGILAFVGAVQLRRFGADIYVANLVGVAVVREMAALMTAIVMAGRTGGAYAAEIASMQGSEEIDALRAIGIPIQDYLVLPRVLALTAMMPLLYLYGSVIGIFGGFAVAIAISHLTPARFVAQILGAVSGGQVVFGLVKSLAFGALIAIAGCRIGMKAGRSASDVGHAATTAVVTGIVGVIALDAVFAICANALSF